MLRAIEQLNRSFPPGLMRHMQAIQRLAPIYQIGSAFYGNLASEVEPPRRKWSVESDQNIPEEFKQKYRTWLASDHRLRKYRRFWELIRSGRREALVHEFERPYDRNRDFYTIEFNGICQYLDLAEQHFCHPELGPVTKRKLWQRICTIHRLYCRWRATKYKRPTHRARLFKLIGLDSIPHYPAGRPLT
jgi:hypothetical protein